jgi:hypothetical protein
MFMALFFKSLYDLDFDLKVSNIIHKDDFLFFKKNSYLNSKFNYLINIINNF